MKKRCRKAGDKVKFKSHEAALTRAGELMTEKHEIPALTTYRCPHGDHWHLTSVLSKKNNHHEKTTPAYNHQYQTIALPSGNLTTQPIAQAICLPRKSRPTANVVTPAVSLTTCSQELASSPGSALA